MSETSTVTGPAPKSLVPLLVLMCSLFALWSLWASWLYPTAVETWGASDAWGLVARLLFWGVPCSVYLRLVWPGRELFPLGLSFPLGSLQVVRAVVIACVLSVALLLATSAQHGLEVGELLAHLGRQWRLRLEAPIFEELVFRGVIFSELLTWTHSSSRTALGLRSRFWLSLCVGALFFLSVHWPFWLSSGGLSYALDLSAPVFVTGLVLGFAYAHTRSIWPCIWLHFLNNELSLLVFLQ